MKFDANIIESLYSKFKAVDCISIDSRVTERLISEGQKVLFFCLKGENFDANSFVNDVLDLGVNFVVTENRAFTEDDRCVVVEDTLLTLQQLAHYHRTTLGIPIISIAGSNGKTTTKELLHRVLSKRYNVSATVGNLNNHIGVPLTLLSIPADSDMAIVEMGANHQQEITQLCDIALPNYGIVVNIGDAHLEGFGGREGVIKGKGELYDFLKQNKGTIFYRSDDAILSEMIALRSPVDTIAYTPSMFVCLEDSPFQGIGFEYKGEVVSTNLIGGYNIYNIATAIAIGEYFEVGLGSILMAISEYKPQNMRSELRVTDRGNRVIVDAYNANPSSMHHSLDNFNKIASDDRCYIIGQMNEMGEYSSVKHREVVDKVIEQVSNLTTAKVFFVGPLFKEVVHNRENITCVNTVEELKSSPFIATISKFDILLKGSRGVHLEKLLQLL